MRAFALLLVLLLTSDVDARGRSKKGRNRCSVPGCARCDKADRTKCATCRTGFALTEDAKCGRCGDYCSRCDQAGPGGCDTCLRGYTRDPVTRQCAACAAHCWECDKAGPGGCNECGPRRMLHVRLEVTGEVHECLSCGPGCRECTEDKGCLACDSSIFYNALPRGQGCVFSWFRLWVAIGLLVLAIGCCAYVSADDVEPRPTYSRAPAARRDATRVVRGSRPFGEGGGASVRKRGGAEQKSELPPQVGRQSSNGPAYPLLQGYNGIEISGEIR